MEVHRKVVRDLVVLSISQGFIGFVSIIAKLGASVLQGTLIAFGYIVVSFFTDLMILGTIGHKIKKSDEMLGVPKEDRGISFVFVWLSCLRVSVLFYLVSIAYSPSRIPIVLFLVIASIELYRGVAQMIHQENIGRLYMRNYYAAKTIGSILGLVMLTFWIYFK